jgi:hypothetical protein
MRYYIKSGEIIEALSAAQADFPILEQNRDGYNYKYLTLDNILNVCRPILGKKGIAITQGAEIDLVDGMPFVKVETRLLYKDEAIENSMVYPLGDAPKGMSEVQYMGSLQSYLRRYSLLGILGIAGAEKEIEDIQAEIKLGDTKLK